jgi:hypothetical protein
MGKLGIGQHLAETSKFTICSRVWVYFPQSSNSQRRSNMTSSDGDTEKASNMSYFRPALLKTESEEDFEKLSDELKRDVQPAPGIELIYTHDFAVLTWEIIRYTRNKAGIINNAFQTALASLLRPLLLPPGPGHTIHNTHLNAQNRSAWPRSG